MYGIGTGGIGGVMRNKELARIMLGKGECTGSLHHPFYHPLLLEYRDL
jgi:hypothetical protein